MKENKETEKIEELLKRKIGEQGKEEAQKCPLAASCGSNKGQSSLSEEEPNL
jgi:hypothetical protein